MMIRVEMDGEDALGNKNDHVELAPMSVIKQNYPNPFNLHQFEV